MDSKLIKRNLLKMKVNRSENFLLLKTTDAEKLIEKRKTQPQETFENKTKVKGRFFIYYPFKNKKQKCKLKQLVYKHIFKI